MRENYFNAKYDPIAVIKDNQVYERVPPGYWYLKEDNTVGFNDSSEVIEVKLIEEENPPRKFISLGEIPVDTSDDRDFGTGYDYKGLAEKIQQKKDAKRTTPSNS